LQEIDKQGLERAREEHLRPDSRLCPVKLERKPGRKAKVVEENMECSSRARQVCTSSSLTARWKSCDERENRKTPDQTRWSMTSGAAIGSIHQSGSVLSMPRLGNWDDLEGSDAISNRGALLAERTKDEEKGGGVDDDESLGID
jgi:hypothetical protein